jgi:hypothetical protein
MLTSVSADSFESVTLTNNTNRNTSLERDNNIDNDDNDVIIYTPFVDIIKDYFCIIILLGTLCIMSYILIKQKYN